MPRNETYPQKNAYMDDKDVEKIVASLEIKDSDQDRDTVEFIKQKERLNAQFVLGKINSGILLSGIRKCEEKYRDKYHNEVHHGNRLLEEFYKVVNSSYLSLVHWKR